MKALRTRSKLITVITLVTLASLGAVLRARAQNQLNPTTDIQFGILGIARGQTARLNVVNVSSPDNPLSPPDPCRVTISFVDTDGNVLVNNAGQPVRREVTLQPGHAASLQINGDTLVARDQLRLAFRPVVVAASIDSTLPPPCIPTLEVIDNFTARTSLLHPGTPVLGKPDSGNHNQTLLRDN